MMNVCDRFIKIATKYKDNIAVIDPANSNKSYTFEQLNNARGRYAYRLSHLGVKRGTKVLLFVKPSFDFPAITFALFQIGAVPILIDPGMGVKNLLKCVAQVKPEVMIGLPITHIIRRIFPKAFKSINTFITTSHLGIFTKPLKTDNKEMLCETQSMHGDDLAAILFTSGGTGIPKGVEYTHDIFISQTQMLQEMFNLTEKDIDCPGFPLFALFTLSMGMKVVIPQMNPSKPATAKPHLLVKNITENKVTFAAGSPAIWEKVVDYCIKNNVVLDSVKYMVMFGAPVRLEIHEKFRDVLPNGTTYTPYGATECLPVSCVSGKDVLNKHKQQVLSGHGVCVGHPAPGVEIFIVPISDQRLVEVNSLPANTHGEIVIKARTVTPRYFEMPEKTALAKIYQDNDIFHRMGDIGFLDNEGRLWFCGRKDHRVDLIENTLYSIPTEAAYLKQSNVNKAALVQYKKLDKTIAAIVVEPRSKSKSIELIKLKEINPVIKDVFIHPKFPVDVRHNIKIDRTKLSKWVQSQVEDKL